MSEARMRRWRADNIMRALCEGGMDVQEIADDLKAIQDQHAHELAEKIISDPKAAEVAYRPGLMWAAEVIDPQADREDA